MMFQKEKIANWGNYPTIEAEVAAPENQEKLRECLAQKTTLLARGNGRCYGDAALNERVVSMLAFKKIRDFNPETGEIECEAGVLLSEILEKTLPLGWFFNVTPGIKNITVGGAIASDVHGKNHPTTGCFSAWLHSFKLMTADGSIVTCSKSTNSGLFWLTCGGMGLTGIILSAKFQLRKIKSGEMLQRTSKCQNLGAIFHAFEKEKQHEYHAAWLDCLPTGKGFGRGLLFSADHDPKPSQEIGFQKVATRNVPFFAPDFFLNPLTIKLHNDWIFAKKRAEKERVGLDQYFYPLDKIENWNRLYGRRGFIQYQFCLPEKNAHDGLEKILKTIQKSPDSPFLTVLKKHGDRPKEALNSFPVRGFSLALDFPRTKTIFSLVSKLDELIWPLGGKIYLTKDACSAGKMGRLSPETFAEPKFDSMLKRRIINS